MDYFMCLLEVQCAKRLKVHSRAIPELVAFFSLCKLVALTYLQVNAQKYFMNEEPFYDICFPTWPSVSEGSIRCHQCP